MRIFSWTVPCRALLSVSAALPFALMACGENDKMTGGTGVGNPPAGTVMISMQLGPGNPELGKVAAPPEGNGLMLRDAEGRGVLLDSVRILVREITFELPESATCADGWLEGEQFESEEEEQEAEQSCEQRETHLRGVFPFELVHGGGSLLPRALLPQGDYGEVELGLDEEQGIRMWGSLLGNGDTSSISVHLQGLEEWEFMGSDTFRVSRGDTTLVRLLLRPEEWFRNVNLSACPSDSARTRTVNVDACLEQSEILLRNLEEASGME